MKFETVFSVSYSVIFGIDGKLNHAIINVRRMIYDREIMVIIASVTDEA